MTLVVPSLDNIFTDLLISQVVKIGAIKPIFLDSVKFGDIFLRFLPNLGLKEDI